RGGEPDLRNVRLKPDLLEGRRTMLRDHHTDRPACAGVALASLPLADGREEIDEDPSQGRGRPRLRVRIIERTALIRFEDAELLFDEELIRALGQQLDRLIREDGHSRLLVNFGGVQYL